MASAIDAPVNCRRVRDSAIHREHRSSQRVRTPFEITGKHRAPVFDIDIKLTKLVSAVGHSSGGHRICHENGAFDTLGPEPQPHELRRDVDTVADQFGIEVLVVQRDAENARLAMIESAHRVEGMRGAAGSGINPRERLRRERVGMAERTAHADACRVGDEFLRSAQLRRDRQQADVSPRRLLKAPEEFDAWLLQILLRVNAALGVREKRAFEVDAAWLRLQWLRLGLNRIRERFKRVQSGVHRSRHGRGQILCDASHRKEALDLPEVRRRG